MNIRFWLARMILYGHDVVVLEDDDDGVWARYRGVHAPGDDRADALRRMANYFEGEEVGDDA